MSFVSISLLQLGVDGLRRSRARETLTPRDAAVLVNVRPFMGKCEVTPGLSIVKQALAGRPRAIITYLHDDNVERTVVITNEKAYKIESGPLTDITRVSGDYTAGSLGFVAKTVYGTNLVFTNNADNIQKWDGIAARCVDLGGSPPKAASIASALTFLMIAGINGVSRGVRWSDSGLFETWTGGDSGNLTLYQGPGEVINLMPLGEVVIAYRESNIHLLYYVGPPFIWGQRQIVTSHGLIAPGAVVDLGEKHIYWGTDNVYLFDGSTRVPIADDLIEDMQNSYDHGYRTQIHAGIDHLDRMVYFFYPSPGMNGVCDKAWVFDYAHGIWHQEDFFPVGISATGPIRREVAPTTWDGDTGTWDQAVDTWDQTLAGSWLLGTGHDSGDVGFFDKSVDAIFGSSTRRKIFETCLFNPGSLILKDIGSSRGDKWTLNRLDVHFEQHSNTVLDVVIGTQDVLRGEGHINWQTFQIPLDGSQEKIDVRTTARFFTFRIANESIDQPFRGSGLIAHFVPKGKR